MTIRSFQEAREYFKVTSLQKHFEPYADSDSGPIWLLENARIFKGLYVTKGPYIFQDSLHEHFSDRWLKYWLKERGTTFGGLKAEDLTLGNKGRHIKLNFRTLEERKISEPVYIFQYTYDHNFHHFIVTALPRLYYFLSNLQTGAKVAVRSDTPDYQLEMILSLIPRSNIIFLEPELVYVCEKLWCPTFLQWTDSTRIEKFYSKYFYNLVAPDLEDNKRIFLSRSDVAEKRPLANAKELSEFARQNKFQELTASNLNLKERVNIFYSAKVLMGVFSAGFANIVFAHNCQIVIFIEHPIYKMPDEYKTICRARNIKLFVIKFPIFKQLIRKYCSSFKRFRKPTGVNMDNSSPWAIEIRKLQNLFLNEGI